MTAGGYRSWKFSTQDGTRLFFRDYGDANARATPVLCLPGLTRNSADFHDLALAATRRVLALDLRGRGNRIATPTAGAIPTNATSPTSATC